MLRVVLGTSYDIVEYSGVRFMGVRSTLREARRILLGELDPGTPTTTPIHERIDPDQSFCCEDGRAKPFRLFVPGEWLLHVHGGVAERSASAKVFSCGFYCFGCNKSYAVPQSPPFDTSYEF